MLVYEKNRMFELKSNLYIKIQKCEVILRIPICVSVYLCIFTGFVLVQDGIFTVPLVPQSAASVIFFPWFRLS